MLPMKKEIFLLNSCKPGVPFVGHRQTSGAILFAQRNFIKNEIKEIKITPNTPENESGLVLRETIRQIWVKVTKFKVVFECAAL